MSFGRTMIHWYLIFLTLPRLPMPMLLLLLRLLTHRASDHKYACSLLLTAYRAPIAAVVWLDSPCLPL
jgi:hypothetical protein